MGLTLVLLVFLASANATLRTWNASIISALESGDLQLADVDLTPLTCRWTNCNEVCPPGYVPVPRQGGAPNEKMWDHTHCGGVGQQLFCCPSEIQQPTCTWRGHRNTGYCGVSGCPPGEVEVGSLTVGCKESHQRACCFGSLGVAAYGQCKWYGTASRCSASGKHAACGKDFPDFIFAASAGFGGEQTCRSGKSLRIALVWGADDEERRKKLLLQGHSFPVQELCLV